MVTELQCKGYEICIVSGSFDIMVNLVAKDLGVQLAGSCTNLLFDEHDLLIRSINNGDEQHAKLDILKDFCDRLGLPITAVACIGDGANDVEMFKASGRGVTFKGSPIEHEAWQIVDSLADIRSIF